MYLGIKEIARFPILAWLLHTRRNLISLMIGSVSRKWKIVRGKKKKRDIVIHQRAIPFILKLALSYRPSKSP